MLLSEYSNINLSVVCTLALIVQFALYTASAFFFATSVTTNKNIKNYIVAGLLLNILFLPLLSLTMTESISIPIMLICYAVFCRKYNIFVKCFFLGLFSAYLTEIRPANIWFYAFIFIILLLDLAENKYLKKEIFYCISLFFLGSLVSFMPQLMVNYINFHRITPFPAVNLGTLQMQAGKEILHVSFVTTTTLNAPISAVITPNPFYIITTNFHWLSLYGFGYFILKLLSILLHDDLFVYQSVSSFFEILVILFSSFCIYFGIAGIYFQKKNLGDKYFRAIILALLLCVLLHVPTQLEDRFTLPIFLILFPVAIYQCTTWVRTLDYKKIALFPIYFLFMYLIHIIFLIMSPVDIELIRSIHKYIRLLY